MGRLFVLTLEGKIYSCKHCGTHLALFENIVSKGECHFWRDRNRMMMTGMHTVADIFCVCCGSIVGWKYARSTAASTVELILPFLKTLFPRHGKAYLFSKVVHVTSGEIENRMMMTGMHTVADIFCVCCGSIVGWKYETAHEKSQKYKEGKSVLERFKICGPDGSHYWASHDTHVAGSDADGV